MIYRTSISTPQDSLYSLFWNLYITAFPLNERRSESYQRETMLVENYHLEALILEEQFVGFIGWWSLGDLCFIEHFATTPSVRNMGYGKEALNKFIEEQSRIVILEVEHPDSEICIRRINFYQRTGFALNDFEYSHPPYCIEQSEPVSLDIMSYPQRLTPTQVQQFKDMCFDQVHFIHHKERKI